LKSILILVNMYLHAKNSLISMAKPSDKAESQTAHPVLDLNLQLLQINNKMEFKLELDQSQLMYFFKQMMEESLKDHFRIVCLDEEATCTESTTVKKKRISSYTIDRKSSLTVREVEILKELSNGLTNPQIAAHFELTVATVKSHIQSIFLKLGVNNRHKAAEEYRRLFET
jgi:DNA-binding CsgD family transcriptional regulator